MQKGGLDQRKMIFPTRIKCFTTIQQTFKAQFNFLEKRNTTEIDMNVKVLKSITLLRCTTLYNSFRVIKLETPDSNHPNIRKLFECDNILRWQSSTTITVTTGYFDTKVVVSEVFAD
jgi:hypothetical protein